MCNTVAIAKKDGNEVRNFKNVSLMKYAMYMYYYYYVHVCMYCILPLYVLNPYKMFLDRLEQKWGNSSSNKSRSFFERTTLKTFLCPADEKRTQKIVGLFEKRPFSNFNNDP